MSTENDLMLERTNDVNESLPPSREYRRRGILFTYLALCTGKCPVKCLLLVTLPLLSARLTPALADLEAGLTAYSQGDYATAATEYRLAARQDDPIAQTRLATLYADGTGLPQNYEEAIRWYRRAALQGHEPARDALEALGVSLFEIPYGPNDDGESSADSSSNGRSEVVVSDTWHAQQRPSHNSVSITIVTHVGLPRARLAFGVGDVHTALFGSHFHFKGHRRHHRKHAFVAERGFWKGKRRFRTRIERMQTSLPTSDFKRQRRSIIAMPHSMARMR